MKRLIPILAIAVLSCANKQSEPSDENFTTVNDTEFTSAEKTSNLLVIPGNAVGNIALELPTDSLKFLGPADLSDAAMGKSWQTWYNITNKPTQGKHELNIYTEYKDQDLSEKVVRQVRITSPEFKTSDGISTGNSLMQIVESHPSIKWMGRFKNQTNGNTVEIFDDSISGIAFEIENDGTHKSCIAMIVHPKNQSVTKPYISFHPDLVRE